MVFDCRTSYRKVKEQVQDFEDDLLAQVEQIHDPVILKRLLIQKEQERIGLASNLDLAARLGLDLHQQIQQMEQDSYTKVASPSFCAQPFLPPSLSLPSHATLTRPIVPIMFQLHLHMQLYTLFL